MRLQSLRKVFATCRAYGIGDAATALTGQSHGAGRFSLVRKFGYMSVGLGMAVMTVMGLLMYVFADEIMMLITPIESISSLGAEMLRIEAWAEPMFAASIVAYGAFVGVGHTKWPAIMNFGEHMACEGAAGMVDVAEHGLERGVDSNVCRADFQRHNLFAAFAIVPLVEIVKLQGACQYLWL